VQYAYRNIPLWRSLLDEKHVSPGSINTLTDISLLPATSKKTFLGRMVEEYVDGSRLHRSVWYVTSGTSGTPFRFLMSEHAVSERYIDFGSFRFLWWRGEALNSVTTTNLARIKIRAVSGKHRLFIPVEDFLRDSRSAMEKIVQFKAEILSTYPSILLEIARAAAKDPTFPRPKPRFVLSFGEMLFPSVRKFVEDTLGCEIYDRYGLEEIGAVGVECSAHDGYHINVESVIVEVTDDSYAPVSPGTQGRVLVTDLFNFGMPFIRYDTGDRGRISYEPCACGLRSARLWVKGRYSAYLAFPTRRIHHLEFDGAMDGFMNSIFQYQIAKRSDTEIVARIIPGPSFDEKVSARVKEHLGKLVGIDVRVDVETVEKLLITPRGKSRIVIDETL
jgi:phenylacetate-CoA ligase